MKTLDFDIIFDNGGGTTLQTDVYCHFFDNPKDAAEAVIDLLSCGDTAAWDGNEPEHRMEYDCSVERNGGYRWLDQDDIKTPGNVRGWGRNTQEFFCVMDLQYGIALKARIKHAGLNQKKLAGLCGVTQQAVCNWVKGSSPVPKYAETIISQHIAIHGVSE